MGLWVTWRQNWWDRLMDWWTEGQRLWVQQVESVLGCYSPGPCAQGPFNIQKACEERDMDCQTIVLKRRVCDWEALTAMPLGDICFGGLEGHTSNVFSVCLSSIAIPPDSREFEPSVSLEIKTKTGFSDISWNAFSSHWICPKNSPKASKISFSSSSDQKQHQQGINRQSHAAGILIHMTRQSSLLY